MAGAASIAESSYQPAQAAPAEAFAAIEYEERGVRKTFYMTRNEMVVGRGGRDYWTDLNWIRCPTFRASTSGCGAIRKAASSFLKDLSRLGTTSMASRCLRASTPRRREARP